MDVVYLMYIDSKKTYDTCFKCCHVKMRRFTVSHALHFVVYVCGHNASSFFVVHTLSKRRKIDLKFLFLHAKLMNSLSFVLEVLRPADKARCGDANRYRNRLVKFQ